MTDTTLWQDPVARQAFLAQGQKIFQRIQDQLEDRSGVVAIEPQSGDFFVGATLGQANRAAFARYPDQWLYFVRIDNPEAEMALPTW